ncbi:nuclear transport factor 2 family protein [Pseudoalteromonas luteoviolacea]|uniref:nuclear transport factor 2 family protein n=1 Tax=Pseudoalteromonas luteoviolacea TaxID=43657 RepID=UPI001F26AB8B|nr:nuclear transport factor 2 family protein [Pseudoalteromonas luteoviolacea]MCF6442844.1 nuclear transport factor 2 family protein [Pseudoalteromonas luteoviolacea]
MNGRAIVEKMFSIIDEREFDRLNEVFHFEVIYQRPGYQEIEGLSDLIHFYKNVRIITCGLHTIKEVISDGATIVCKGYFQGKSGKGEMLETRFSDYYQLKDGKISRRETYFFQPHI